MCWHLGIPLNSYLELTPSLKLPKLNKRLGVYSKIYGNLKIFI